MKELAGKPQSFFNNLKSMIGQDYLYWPLPTYPLLNVNYFEKLYTYKQIERLPKFEEDEYDIDKKLFAKLKKSVDKEKTAFVVILLLLMIVYVVLCHLYLFEIWDLAF